MNVDSKLLKNLLEDTERLKSQLNDLEAYKEDFDEEEYNKIKQETLDHLIQNAKMIENMQTGKLGTVTEADEAKKRIAEVINENYNIKELMNTYLGQEVFYLRDNLKRVESNFALKKINIDTFQHSVSNLLAAIGKVTELNDHEKELNNSLKDKVIMNKYQKDEGLNKENIEQKIKK